MLANLIRRPTRSVGALSFADYEHLWEQFGFNGVQYMVPSGSITQMTAMMSIRNPIILAIIIIRASAFSEIRFAFQNLAGGRAGRDLFGSSALGILEHPWPGASTGDLLSRMEFDASMYGNSYWYKSAPGQLTWIDPSKMKILTGDQHGPSGANAGSTLLAYQTQSPNGQPEETWLPDEIVHYRPLPDPNHPFRGLSWLASLLPDVGSDQDMTEFKRGFLRNSATPSLIVQFTGNIGRDAFNAFKDKFETSYVGPQAAFKTLYLGAGADVKTVGSNWKDMELYGTQSYGETRLCAAGGVPATMVGIAEGLKGSALNAGNYTATRRRFADLTIRPQWRMVCSALEAICPPPSGSRLWYDDRDVLFLTADMQDAAAVRQSDAATIVALSNAGFDPQTVVDSVIQGDWATLKHGGLLSVQLQPMTPPDPPPPPADSPTDLNENNSQQLLLALTRQQEPMVVNIHQAPVTVNSAPVTLEPPNVTVNSPPVNVAPPNVTVTGPAALRMVRETNYIKDEHGEIVGHTETEHPADD